MIVFNRPVPREKLKLLIFDLDGTLVDSRLDLANSINAMLRNFGRAELTQALSFSCMVSHTRVNRVRATKSFSGSITLRNDIFYPLTRAEFNVPTTSHILAMTAWSATSRSC